MAKFSKTKIEKAGRMLVDSSIKDSDINDPLDALDYWRSSHNEVLLNMEKHLYKITSKIKNARIFSRLKRKDSIINKLVRFSKTNYNLREMDDIAGCRVVVETIDDVKKIKESLLKDKYFHNCTDYIENPKDDGYRSVHILSRLNTKAGNYGKLRVETQIRTELQHAWSVMVEVYDLCSHSKLKFGEGTEEEVMCFSLLSQLIAIKEGTTLISDLPVLKDKVLEEFMKLNEGIHLIQKIIAFNDSIQFTFLNKQKDYSHVVYYLIMFDYKEGNLKILTFNKSTAKYASSEYAKKERELMGKCDVLLVKASSLEELKTGYPNYFSDLWKYIHLINEVLDNKFINKDMGE